MPRDVVLPILEGALGVPPESLSLSDPIKDQWDSIAMLGFMAGIDEELGVVVSPEKILACQTVADVLAVVYGKSE